MSHSEIIDLTKSEYCSRINDCYNTSNVVEIVILDDSIHQSPVAVKNPTIKSKKKAIANKKFQTHSSPVSSKKKSGCIGDCPICLEELGKNPLGSTKCGHVYCLHCLKKALRKENKCPTCRSSLKGPSAYHPLYLG